MTAPRQRNITHLLANAALNTIKDSLGNVLNTEGTWRVPIDLRKIWSFKKTKQLDKRNKTGWVGTLFNNTVQTFMGNSGKSTTGLTGFIIFVELMNCLDLYLQNVFLCSFFGCYTISTSFCLQCFAFYRVNPIIHLAWEFSFDPNYVRTDDIANL